MGNEHSDPTSMGSNYEFVPLPVDSPFLSDHGLGEPEPPPRPGAGQASPPSSQFPPSSYTSNPASATTSSVPERPSPAQPPPPPPPTGGFALLQDGISSFPLYMGAEDSTAVRRLGATSGAIPVGAAIRTPESDLMTRIKSVLVTATDSVQGRIVDEYIGPVDAQVIVPTRQLLEGSEPQGKLLRHKVAQHRLRQFHQLLQAELRLEADKIGANAVLAASIQMREIQDVIVLSAFGSAVRLA
jgi:uncharacterized protein YbjQ (UPF0145 family)